MSEDTQNTDSNHNDPNHTWHDDTPFPRRWIGYVVLKVAILILAVLIALWWYGLV